MTKQFSIKYRPESFGEVQGQKGVILELKNRSKDMNFPQAMLFSGYTGSGKSTIAFIVGKLINCEKPVEKIDSNNLKFHAPCNECPSCKSVVSEKFNRDIQLMDASKLAKQDLVELEETVNYTPMYSDNKVVIIDEIQEFTSKQHKTLLKIIEKQRENVYFIFTTMQLDKIHQSFIDRCQHYKLSKLSFEDISDGLFYILEKEGLVDTVPEEFITEGLVAIADNSMGSLRHAVQSLERAIYGEYWTKELIEQELGFISNEKLNDTLLDLLRADPKFFRRMNSMDVKEFFHKSYYTLVESAIYKLTGDAKQAWKRQMYKTFVKEKNLFELIDIYNYIQEKSFYDLKENFFLSRLIAYFNKHNAEGKLVVAPPIPTRVKKS